MVRRLCEVIEVHAEAIDDHLADPTRNALTRYLDWSPRAFVWRGRIYHVRAVLAHWRERRSWWREALDPPMRPDGTLLAGGVASAARERHVWRVEATPGRLRAAGAHEGIYDLACDEDDAGVPLPTGWQLLRISD